MAKQKKKIFGGPERPRLSVFRSARHIYAQVINDGESKTVVTASSLKMKKGNNVAAAREVGRQIAGQALAQGVKKVVFDRGRYKYHGRVEALAQAAREGGLEF